MRYYFTDLIAHFGIDGNTPAGLTPSERTIIHEGNDPQFQYQVILNKVARLIDLSKSQSMFDVVEMEKFLWQNFAGPNTNASMDNHHPSLDRNLCSTTARTSVLVNATIPVEVMSMENDDIEVSQFLIFCNYKSITVFLQ